MVCKGGSIETSWRMAGLWFAKAKFGWALAEANELLAGSLLAPVHPQTGVRGILLLLEINSNNCFSLENIWIGLDVARSAPIPLWLSSR